MTQEDWPHSSFNYGQEVPPYVVEKSCKLWKDVPENKNYVLMGNFPENRPANFSQ